MLSDIAMLNGEHRYERQICRGRAAAARKVLTWTESHFVASKVRFGFDMGKASCHHFPYPTHHHHDDDHDCHNDRHNDCHNDQEERDTCSASDSFVWQLWEAGWRGLGLA